MNKKEWITQIRAAKAAHIVWHGNAISILKGLEQDHNKAELLSTSTKFGKWFYSRGQSLSSFGSYQFIDQFLTEIHSLYMKMYELTYSEAHGSLFVSKKSQKKKNLKQAQNLIEEFDFTSNKLLSALDQLAQEIFQSTDEMIESLI
jgi:hypothetical protein